MLRNPAYTGRAAFGRTSVVHRPTKLTRPGRQRGGGAGRYPAAQGRPREEWNEIPVPAIVDETTFALAAEQLQDLGDHVHILPVAILACRIHRVIFARREMQLLGRLFQGRAAGEGGQEAAALARGVRGADIRLDEAVLDRIEGLGKPVKKDKQDKQDKQDSKNQDSFSPGDPSSSQDDPSGADDSSTSSPQDDPASAGDSSSSTADDPASTDDSSGAADDSSSQDDSSDKKGSANQKDSSNKKVSSSKQAR